MHLAQSHRANKGGAGTQARPGRLQIESMVITVTLHRPRSGSARTAPQDLGPQH